MEEYSNFIARDGRYLGVMDLAVLCAHWKSCPTCIFYDLGFQDLPELKPLPLVLHGLTGGLNMPEIPVAEDRSDPKCWFLVACRADFVRDDFQKLNHWLPAWPKEQLEDFWVPLTQSCLSKLQKKIGSAVKRLQSESADSDDDLKFSLQDQLDLLMRKQEMFQKLINMDLFPVDVLGDGNCLLWALDGLKAGPSVRTSLSTGQRASEMRKETCEMD